MESQETLENQGGRTGKSRNFLSKLSGWLNPLKRSDPIDPTEAMLRQGDEADQLSRSAGSPAELTWPRRRTNQISRLEEGFDKLVNLVDTLDRHAQKQAERSEQVVSQIRRIADALSQNQGLERQQTEAVEDLANQYRNQGRQMAQVAEAVEALPRAIKSQSEQLGRIRDQLEAQLEAQLSSSQGIQQLAGAADVIRSAAEDQRRQFQQVQETHQAASIQIVQALERQNRRFTYLMAFGVALAMLAAAGSVVAILLATR